MRRRAFAFGLSALAVGVALSARAQQPGRTYRVGALFGGGREAMQRYRRALSEQLATQGFVEGRNLEVDARGATGQFHEDREVVREFVAAKRDAIFACETRATEAAMAATKSLPIVFTWVADPVASGLIKSYANPGGNTTGVTNRYGELLVKRLQLVRELLPKAKRVAVLRYAADQLYETAFAQPLRKAAAELHFELLEVPGNQWAPLAERAHKAGAEAILPNDRFVGTRLSGEQVVEVTNRLRIPTVFANANMVEAGGLISLGTNLEDELRRAANLLVRVLKGMDPAALPIDQTAIFELVLNVKAARSIGLAVPPSVYLRADRVIE